MSYFESDIASKVHDHNISAETVFPDPFHCEKPTDIHCEKKIVPKFSIYLDHLRLYFWKNLKSDL